MAKRGSHRVKLEAYCQLQKDAGTTARDVTINIRRGTLITSPLVAAVKAKSQGVANSVFGPACLVALDNPGPGTYTYGLFGLASAAAASTAQDKALVAQECSA